MWDVLTGVHVYMLEISLLGIRSTLEYFSIRL